MFALNSRHSFAASLDDKTANVYGLSERTRPQPTEIQVEVETETYVQVRSACLSKPTDAKSFNDDLKKDDVGSDHDVKYSSNSSQARLTHPAV